MLMYIQVREAQMAQYNYILVVGEAEVSSGQVSVLFPGLHFYIPHMHFKISFYNV